jgi:hypothetical protein
MFAPASQIGPITPDERRSLISKSVVAGVYEKDVDRESAFEKLRERAATANTGSFASPTGGGGRPADPARGGAAAQGGLSDLIFGSTGPRGGRRDGLVDILAKTATRTAGSAITRQILRGMLGSLTGSRKR